MINIIVLLNLLIAMMNHSYQLISVSSVGTWLFWMPLILFLKHEIVWHSVSSDQRPAACKRRCQRGDHGFGDDNFTRQILVSRPTRLSLREQRNIVKSDVLDRFNMMTMMIVQETDNVTRQIQHGKNMMMIMMVIYILWCSVCLFVTKNHHFLLGVSCNHLNPS